MPADPPQPDGPPSAIPPPATPSPATPPPATPPPATPPPSTDGRTSDARPVRGDDSRPPDGGAVAGGAVGGHALAGLRLALTTLTVLPVRGPDRLDRVTASWAMRLAPLVGLLLALPLCAVLLGVERLTSGPPLLACVLVVAVHALLTRGLHLDGLADLVDGLGSYRTPERARAVMKAPDVGALGAAALVLAPAVQVSALLACTLAGGGGPAVLLAVVTGRVAVTAACTAGVPAAAPDGLGALVAGTVPSGLALAIAVLTAGAGTALAAAEDLPLLLPAAAVTAGLLVARLVRGHAVRRIGGITGDVLGALVEVTTAVVLVVLALRP